MTRLPDIDKPPSEVEIAEAIDALHAAGCQHQAMAVRRLAFQRDALKETVQKLARDGGQRENDGRKVTGHYAHCHSELYK